MVELWADIIGELEGHYMVSNFGNVKSVRKMVGHRFGGFAIKQSKIRKQSTDKRGYKYITLSVSGKNKTYSVHRLVAITFIENPMNKKEVNHKDGNPSNNKIINLEWATPKENSLHAHITGLCDEMHKINSITCIKRNSKIVLNLNSGIFYDSAKEAAMCHGIKHSTLKSRLNGNNKNKSNLIYI